jgi:spectinomycin phosphotransferase/16S rRNA (guanine(1405)-N(7))-methyltransferase
MFTRPQGLSDAVLIDALREGWGLKVASIEYQAVGFGSHHWDTTDTGGNRWFVTVWDLDAKRRSADDDVFDRLRAALATSRAVYDTGAAFVVAPVPARDGAVVLPVSEQFALALYPYVDGRTDRGEYRTAADRLAVMEMLVVLHASHDSVTRHARVDDFGLAKRDDLELALDDLAAPWDGGPYSERTRALLSRHASGVARLLEVYDTLAAEARERPDRMVLTHGEPHIENVMLTANGLVLIDWDTTLLAPPERDLWMLEPSDGLIPVAYAEARGVAVLSTMLDLYRMQWDLAEIAIYTAEFREPHVESDDTRESWKNLTLFLDPARRWPSLM